MRCRAVNRPVSVAPVPLRLSGSAVDNPGQRICADAASFVSTSVFILTTLITKAGRDQGRK